MFRNLHFTLTIVLVAVSGILSAQNGFKSLNSLSLPFEPSELKYEHTPEFQHFLCSSKTDMLMIDGINGKILWQINFPKEFSLKKISNQFWNKEANVVLVYDEDTKKAIAKKYFIDGKTGKVLWTSDKYVSEFGEYKLSDGFQNYYEPNTKGVLLPTKEKVEFVNVQTGAVIWSKAFELTGKAKNFDCYLMSNYDLVKIVTGEESEMYLTVKDGSEVSDINPYYNKKKALTTAARTTYLEIPEKNCYVIMKGKESGFMNALGILTGSGTGYQAWSMKFAAYEIGTDKLLWEKEHKIAQSFDWINNKPYVKMLYSSGKIFVEHEPNLKSNSGLTVLDVNTGEKAWECYYTTSEMKGLNTVTLTPFPAPDPVVYNNRVYVVDKVKNKVICYDLNNGSKIWESEKYEDAQKIPSLIAIDGKIIMTMGGAAEKIEKSQAKADFCFGYRTSRRRVICSGGQQYTYKYVYNSKDKYGLIAYNAETGKIEWSNETIEKGAKDKFSKITFSDYIDGKFYCATDKNFFTLDSKGTVLSTSPISKEKVGDIWGVRYFEKQKQFVVNCQNGIVKIDASNGNILGSLKTPNVEGVAVSVLMNGDDSYDDYAIFTDGNEEKMDYKEFAIVDLNKMTIRGKSAADILFADNPHFAEGGEKFFISDGKKITIYSAK